MAHMYHDRKKRGLLWVDVVSNYLPHAPVVAGYEANGTPVYIGRCIHDGNCIPGKYIQSMGACYVGHQGQEHPTNTCQVLTNPKHKNLVWVWASNGHVPPNAIVGGAEKDGAPLFIGRTNHHGNVVSGKIHQGMGVLYYSMNGSELSTPNYEVLVKA